MNRKKARILPGAICIDRLMTMAALNVLFRRPFFQKRGKIGVFQASLDEIKKNRENKGAGKVLR